MSDEAAVWLRYAEENRQTAKLCLENGLINPSIQNSQQAIEKALKALCLASGIGIRKTHNTSGLRSLLGDAGIDCGISDDETDLMDAVYLPSKYPLGSVLPDFDPDADIASRCLSIADRVLQMAARRIDRRTQ